MKTYQPAFTIICRIAMLAVVTLFTASLATSALATPAGSKALDTPKLQKVLLVTSLGNITLELYAAKAPKTVANFVRYVKEQHYDGTIFHRVIDNFMIQGGGFDAKLTEKPVHEPIALEAAEAFAKELRNATGFVAMARTYEPNSASSQFYINVKDNFNLDPSAQSPGYTVFGKVIKGMEVVNKIKSAPTGDIGPFQNVPTQTITLVKATLIK